MVGRRSARAGFLAMAAVASLLLAATGCGGSGGGEAAAEDLAGTELCGGDAVSTEASKALKVITGASRFGTTAETSTVAHAAKGLVEAWPYPTGGRDDICRVYTAAGSPEFELRVTWGLEGGAPTGSTASDLVRLRMGEETLAGEKSASMVFACRSDRFPGATKPAHVRIGVERWGMPKPVEGDAEALRNAYATVAHSFSLAMAKELGCEKNGGLPAQPVLEPA
ncbi:hypothetical protein [Streptomyces sp. NPDC002640]